VPYFASSFAELLVLRAVFGVGMGALMCMQNPVTTALIPVEQRAKILGTGMFCGFAMQCILQYFGGVLIDHFRWNCGFLIHILLVLPLIMIIFFLPDTGMEVKEKATVQESETVQNGLPLKAIALCVMWGISFMMIVPLLIGCAFLSNQIVQSAMWAGVVAVCFSFGCMTGGLVFDKIYGIFKRRVMTVCLLVMAAGLLGSAAVRSILLLCIFNYIAGIGMSSLQASMMMVLGMICHPSKVGLASSIMVSLQNILTFFCSMYEELVGMISGDSLYMPLYVGCTAYIIFAAVLFIKPPFPTESGH
jgi:MFS family permease